MTNEEAIKRLNKIKAIYKGMDNKSDVKALDMAISALEKQTDTAEWITVSKGEVYECSNCRYKILIHHNIKPYKFCPNCGRRMMKESEDEK